MADGTVGSPPGRIGADAVEEETPMQLTVTVHRHDPAPLGWGNCPCVSECECAEVRIEGDVSEETARVLSVDGVPADRLDAETASQAEECLWLESESRRRAAGGAR